MIDGEFIVNPTMAQKNVSDLQLTVASTSEKVIMIEAGANEVPEAKMIEAIFKAHEVNQEIIKFIDTIVAECGKPKHSYEQLRSSGGAVRRPSRRSFLPKRWKRLYSPTTSRSREENIRQITEKTGRGVC